MIYPLYQFSIVTDFETKLEELSQLAQQENWSYRYTPSNFAYPILFNYVHYTFKRIETEGKIAYSQDNDRACFNTGLVTPNYEEIYAFFTPNRNSQIGSPEWFLQGFRKESDRDLIKIGKLPDIAHYFDDPASLLYDPRKEVRKKIDHIIDENRERFPEPFKSMEDNYQLRIALEGAIDHATRRVIRNYKTAVPQFYQGRIQLLLPLCMTNRSKADLALVIYEEGLVYLASTCLTLDMAYNNARLLARPDNEWLNP